MSEPQQPPVPPYGQPNPSAPAAPQPPAAQPYPPQQAPAAPPSALPQPVAQPYPPQAQSYPPQAQPEGGPAQPAQPYAQPAQPYAQPAQPYAQPAQPYAQPAQPYAQPAQPYSYASVPRSASSGSGLGRTALIFALVAVGLGLVSSVLHPVFAFGPVWGLGLVSGVSGFLVLATSVTALILGLVAVRRPGTKVLAGIAIGIASVKIAGVVISWLSNLFYLFL